MDRSPQTRAALAFAEQRHSVVTHPVEVAQLLRDAGYSDEVVAAGVLHDVLEDTDVERPELEGRFGPSVAELVVALTDDPSIEDPAERKAALRRQVAEAGECAAAVFAADKVSKVRELHARLDRGDFRPGDRTRLEHYEASLEMLGDLMPGHALLDMLREELGALA